MTEILLIRHGETDWNAEKRLQGHADIPLNRMGWQQAIALKHALSAERVDAIISSDLLRARQTAQEIAMPHGLEVHIEPDLRERCYGAFEGLLYVDIKQRYPEAYKAWKGRNIDARLPDGERIAETLRGFAQRSIGTITRLVNHHQSYRIVLVTHGGVLECAYRSAQGGGFEHARDFDIFNASINRFIWQDESLKLLEWGKIGHLDQHFPYILDEIGSQEV